MSSYKGILPVVSVLALGAMFCSPLGLIPQGVSETLGAITEQVPAIETQMAAQLTEVATQMTGGPDVGMIQTQVAQQLTEIASGQQGGTDNIPTNTPPGGLSGSVSGNLSYPSEGIPPMAVIAYRVGGQPNEYYFVVTEQNQSTYQLDNLPLGLYTIVAYPMLEGNSLAGGYSQAVPCGLSVNCNDHSLIPVIVAGAQVTPGVDPTDWYAPEGTFPPNPLP